MIWRFHDEQGVIYKNKFVIDNGKEGKIKECEMYEIDIEKIKREFTRYRNALNFDKKFINEADRAADGTADSEANSCPYK